MGLKLIAEHIEEVEYITEENEKGEKEYKIKGIFMQADVKNRNGRVYPLDILKKEVSNYNRNFTQQKEHSVN